MTTNADAFHWKQRRAHEIRQTHKRWTTYEKDTDHLSGGHNIAIMRVFVRLGETLALHKELAHKLFELERKLDVHDTSIRTLFDAIRELAAPPPRPRREIGLHIKEDSLPYHLKR
jgi:hypothetical protein